MKILLAGLCWALVVSGITPAVFGSYFKVSSSVTPPKNIVCRDNMAAAAPQASAWAVDKAVALLAAARLRKSPLTS